MSFGMPTLNRDNRRLLINVLGNYAIKGASLIVSLVVMPAYISYFTSQAVLGVWFTLIALLNWVLLFDFGIGGGVRNQIVDALEKHDSRLTSEILSTAYLLIGAIALILIVLAWPICHFVDWNFIFGVSSADINEDALTMVVYILFVGLALRFFSVLVSHILYAMQKAVIPSLIILLSNILILVYLLCANQVSCQGNLLFLGLATAIAYNVPALVVTIVVFVRYFKETRVRFRYFRLTRAQSLLGAGGGLLYLQILVAFIFGIKEILISWFAGPAQVVDYQIYFKLIGLAGSLFALAMTPIWSDVTRSLVQRNYHRITSLYKNGCKMIIIFGIGQLFLVPIMPWVIQIWLGSDAVEVSYLSALVFCLFNIFYMWVMMNFNFACGLTLIKPFAIHLSIAAILNILLAAWFCAIEPNWLMVIIATIIALVPCSLFAPKHIFHYLNSIHAQDSSKVVGIAEKAIQE